MRYLLLAALCAAGTYGCVPRTGAGPAPAGDARWASLPDTLVCVVDRLAERGLREIPAKRDADGGVLLLVDGAARPLEEVHPVGLFAGYAGNESWVRAGEPIRFQDRGYTAVPGERRIRLELLQQVGEYRAIALFADPGDDPPADALYLPSRPGCVFRAYVREDLTRR